MKFLTLLTFAAGALSAAITHEKRQTANDFVEDGCKDIVMIYARGSTELGNVVCTQTSGLPAEKWTRSTCCTSTAAWIHISLVNLTINLDY